MKQWKKLLKTCKYHNSFISFYLLILIINSVRFGNKEVANIAALLGGIVAQEAIKLITHQYIPINNTCIFNGITATSNVFEL